MVQYKEGSIPIVSDADESTLIAVIGPNGGCASKSLKGQCDTQRNMVGPYTQLGQDIPVPTVFEALQTVYNTSSSVTVKYSQGCEVNSGDTKGLQPAVELAGQANAIVLVGETLSILLSCVFFSFSLLVSTLLAVPSQPHFCMF